jgi:cysteine desulfurase / selenocysteine lyase
MSIYLDNAATTYPKPEQVYRALDHAMRRVGVGPGRGSHSLGLAASRLVFEAREAVAGLFGIRDSSRVIFTHSATEALNLAVTGILRPGDHVVSTTMEHNSLVRPLKVAEKSGVEITWVAGDGCGIVDEKAVCAALRGNTRLVALSHCSNVTGTLQAIGEIGAVTRKSGLLLLADVAQSAGTVPIDVGDMNIDLLAVPGHKGLYGPQGTGILYVAEGVDLSPLIVGGTGGFSSSDEQPEVLPERFESGTMNTPGIAGLKAGVDFVRETGIEALRRHESSLVDQLLEGFSDLPAVIHYAPDKEEKRGGVVSFTVSGHDPSEIGFRLDNEFDIAVRVGLHCAPWAHRTIGTFPGGTVRVSPGYFNTSQDIEEFLRALRSIVD